MELGVRALYAELLNHSGAYSMAGGKEQASVGNTGPQRGTWNSRDNHSSHPRQLSLCSETDKMHNWTRKNKVPALSSPKNGSCDPDELTREIQTEGWWFSRLSSDSDKDLGTWIVSIQEKETAQVWGCNWPKEQPPHRQFYVSPQRRPEPSDFFKKLIMPLTQELELTPGPHFL